MSRCVCAAPDGDYECAVCWFPFGHNEPCHFPKDGLSCADRARGIGCLDQFQAMVRAFHEKFEQPARGRPQQRNDVDWAAHDTRRSWIESELIEVYEAMIAGDVSGLADGYLDILYFAMGGLVDLGVRASPLMDAIHAANMTKIKIPGQAKIAKPPGFQHPDIAALIEEQRKH